MASREGGNGVTLTEPVVDKTLRQIRQSRVWSLFCFPPLLLSGEICPLLFSATEPEKLFLYFLTLLKCSPPSSLFSVQTEIFLLLSRRCAVTPAGSRHLFSSFFLLMFSSLGFTEKQLLAKPSTTLSLCSILLYHLAMATPFSLNSA